MRISTKISISIWLLLLCAMVLTLGAWQNATFFGQNLTVLAGATPGFGQGISTGSTLSSYAGISTTFGTTVNTCATRAICINFVDPPPAGSLGLLSYQASDTPASSETVSDDKSNTWTCGTPTDQATDFKKINICYAPNLAGSTNQVVLQFSGNVTNVSVRLHWFYNMATSTPEDGTNGNTGTCGSSANDCTAGSFTPTVGNDLIYTLLCRTQTPNTTSFTAGSTQANTIHALLTTDINDGCADQWGVQTSAGAINPQMTTATSTRYAAKAIALKSGAGGTAPSGMYIRKIQSWSNGNETTGPYSLQFPSTGNLLVSSNPCGGSGPQVSTGITDGTNTWTSPGSYTVSPHATNMLYVQNATANASGLISETTSGTGDCTFKLYDIVGAATSGVYRGRQNNSGVETTVGTSTKDMLNILPGADNGITLFNSQFQNNTAVAFTSPSACHFDAVFYGGEPIDGPNPMDQNGAWGHCNNAANTLRGFAVAFANTSIKNSWIGEADSFLSATGNAAQYAQIIQRCSNDAAASASTIAVTCASTTAGNLLAVVVKNGSSRTITKICTDGATCGAGNSFTQATSAAGSSGTDRTDGWYILSAPGGATTITVTYSGSAVNREATVWEVKRPSGSWTFDLAGPATKTGTGSGNINTGNTITTTGSTGIMFSIMSVGNTVNKIPSDGNECRDQGNIYATTTDAAQAAVLGSATTHACANHDTSATDSFLYTAMAFK